MKSKSPIYIIVAVILFCACGLFLAPYCLNWAADFLVVKDELSKADVIIVLGGDNNGERVAEGVNLYKKGYAPYMVLTGGLLGWRLTHAQNMRDQAVFLGVPKKVILLEEKSRSTIENARFTLPVVKGKGFKSIILVSSPYHMRRSLLVFKKIYGSDYTIVGFPAQNTQFNAHDWWKRNEDSQVVVHEWISIFGYYFRGYFTSM